ncbi:nitrilase-related carbon-nitrogen hydrolase [candidate division KSB1 bacterium]
MITRIALAQISAYEDIQENLKKAETFMRKAADEGAQIICFPEMSFMRFFPQYRCDKKFFEYAEQIPGPTVERFQNLARELHVITIINIFEKEGRGEYYNTSPVINSDGEILGKSQMLHIAEEPLFNEKYYYKPGKTGFPVFRTKHGTIGVAICYDRHYPEQMRALVIQGADILFTPQAGIKGNPVKLYEREMQAVSFSNQVFVALVNRCGVEDEMEFVGGSFVTEPSGDILARGGAFKEELIIADCDLTNIDKMRQERPFLRDRRPELYGILREL